MTTTANFDLSHQNCAVAICRYRFVNSVNRRNADQMARYRHMTDCHNAVAVVVGRVSVMAADCTDFGDDSYAIDCDDNHRCSTDFRRLFCAYYLYRPSHFVPKS